MLIPFNYDQGPTLCVYKHVLESDRNKITTYISFEVFYYDWS